MITVKLRTNYDYCKTVCLDAPLYTSVLQTHLGVCLADVILHATLRAELLLAQQAHVLPHGAPCLFGMGLESSSVIQ